MRKNAKKLLTVALASTLGLSTLASCGGSRDEVVFWIYGTTEQVNAYRALEKEFNATYGAEHDIKVSTVLKSADAYKSSIETLAFTSAAPDVFMMSDDPFKSYAVGGYSVPLDEYFAAVPEIDLSGVRSSMIDRYHFDKQTNTSNPSDPLYAVPLTSLPTALYYNKTMFEQAGIFIISVDEENLERWNNNEIADNNGVYKRDLENVNGLTLDGVTVPAKGYFRSELPYYYDGEDTISWRKPAQDEILVFNNRIAMNWDEIEDLGMLFTGYLNPKDGNPKNTVTEYGTTYGYFTEWWFNYGWSVGGDCLQDLTGEGEWNFSLLDPNPNYIVVNGTYTGANTSKVYSVGETIEFLDKMDVASGEVLVPDSNGGYEHADGSVAGISDGILTAVENGTLAEMPSTREAFKRYLKLGASEKTKAIEGEAGLNISPNPDKFPRTDLSMRSFWNGEMAIIAQTSVWIYDLADQANKRGFTWDVAPLAVYKAYEDPSDPTNDTVVVRGKDAGHSDAYSMALCVGSTKKQKAATFIKWAASEAGQSVLAKHGFFPNQANLIDELVMPSTAKPGNIKVFSEAMNFQTPGDWWYMPDVAWVQEWCVELNSYVRNGKMTFSEWINGTHPQYKCKAVDDTNAKLLEYRKYS